MVPGVQEEDVLLAAVCRKRREARPGFGVLYLGSRFEGFRPVESRQVAVDDLWSFPCV